MQSSAESEAWQLALAWQLAEVCGIAERHWAAGIPTTATYFSDVLLKQLNEDPQMPKTQPCLLHSLQAPGATTGVPPTEPWAQTLGSKQPMRPV